MLKPGSLVISCHPILATSIDRRDWHRLNDWVGIVQRWPEPGKVVVLITHNNVAIPVEDLGLSPFPVNTPISSIVDLTPYQGILE